VRGGVEAFAAPVGFAAVDGACPKAVADVSKTAASAVNPIVETKRESLVRIIFLLSGPLPARRRGLR
jgi:hypothetical protein